MPYVAENRSRRRLEHARQLAVVIPCPRDGLFVDRAFVRTKFRVCRGNIGLRAVEPDVPLALLLGIVERMRVEEGPHELPAHIFEPEFEMRVLINGVMPAEE